MEVLNDILGYPNRKIYQNNEFFSFSLDSIMLANFVTIRMRDKKIIDLGTGNGVIPLILSLRTNKKIIGVEIQPELFNLAFNSVLYNHLENQISIICSDMKDYVTRDTIEQYDVVTCNPPYFKVNDKNYFNGNRWKTIARHEVKISLEEVVMVASKLLKNNGTFAIVHRTERLFEIFEMFRKYHIEPKRVRFVHEFVSKPSTLVLIEGVKFGNLGLKVEPPFIMKKENGRYSSEYEQILVEVKSCETE